MVETVIPWGAPFYTTHTLGRAVASQVLLSSLFSYCSFKKTVWCEDEEERKECKKRCSNVCVQYEGK